jgi:hypothetical protein
MRRRWRRRRRRRRRREPPAERILYVCNWDTNTCLALRLSQTAPLDVSSRFEDKKPLEIIWSLSFLFGIINASITGLFLRGWSGLNYGLRRYVLR